MNRGELMQTVDLMKAVRDNPDYSRSRIVAMAGINFLKGYKMLKRLRDNGFIVFIKVSGGKRGGPGTCVKLSSEGLNWINGMDNLLLKLNNGYDK